MSSKEARSNVRVIAGERKVRTYPLPHNIQGVQLKVPEYFGEHVFYVEEARNIPDDVKAQIKEVSLSGKHLSQEHAEIVARAVTDWAIDLGATHFCHWFQPLTGATAEKHDAFLDFDKNQRPIVKLSASQLMQGEPDASSFPNGGGRSTFEARGYTSWDISSPMFLLESANGKTLCIPTAFFSYTAEALDIKTPLLRSITALSQKATKFLHLTGNPEVERVQANCGAEQEYFLVDKALYFARPDLVMTGRALFCSKTSRNQQLDDHYFGTIPERVESFMQELEVELYKLGIPAKTRHNEVAPGQFEIAPIFCDANVAADQNQLVMSVMKRVALRHDFVSLLHEKPFPGINGSGKHLNWSMSDDHGRNLLNPGDDPHENHRFLAMVAIVCEAVKRHSEVLRASISGPGNDHRLGANEAPPSIISVFLGDTLQKIFDALRAGGTFKPDDQKYLDIGTTQLAQMVKDNTDRNRTSPFAFTGNKFEFRAVGSSKSIGLPLSMLNAAVADVLDDSNKILEKELEGGKGVEECLSDLARHWMESCHTVIFNGDGYSEEWVKEAEERGLPNHKNTAEALKVLSREDVTAHLVNMGVLTPQEIYVRQNILMERYNILRIIEMRCLVQMVNQRVLPAAFEYKRRLAELVYAQKDLGTIGAEKEYLTELTRLIEAAATQTKQLEAELNKFPNMEELDIANKISKELMPLMESATTVCEELEDIIPNELWCLPTAYDMLFVR